MSDEETRTVVRTTLAMMASIADCTRTHADNLMVMMLRANEDRLVEAVRKASLAAGSASATDEQIRDALDQVGIRI